MLTAVVVELKNGFTFRVEHDVKTVSDVQRLIAKANQRIAAAKKALPEIADEAVVRMSIKRAKEEPVTVAS